MNRSTPGLPVHHQLPESTQTHIHWVSAAIQPSHLWDKISHLCYPLLLLPSIFPSIRVFSNESALRIRWPKYWSFSFNIRWEEGWYFQGEWWSMREGVSQKLLLLCHLKICHSISLVAHWQRICLPTQGTWVWSLVGKIPHTQGLLSPCTTITEPVL